MTSPHLILAPLRGFTDAVFRNAFQRHYKGIDEAVAPFVTSIKRQRIKASHLYDLAPDQNVAMPVVPQILSKDSDEFICLAKTLFDLGYAEINWNLGCPYPMVAKKMRGSGLLPYPDTIDRLLEEILSGIPGRFSIKTRLGRFSADEMDALIPIFNRYPISRIIVHPRIGEQMYAGSVNVKAFANCLEQINHPVVYNGDINTPSCFVLLQKQFPKVNAWMLGRGLITNPLLPELIKCLSPSEEQRQSRFIEFHDDLVDSYGALFCGPGHVLDRMKGFWRYFADGFDDGRRILKHIRRANSLKRYRMLVNEFLISTT